MTGRPGRAPAAEQELAELGQAEFGVSCLDDYLVRGSAMLLARKRADEEVF
jgi:hypothetical protein